jgi:hypothetical protein
MVDVLLCLGIDTCESLFLSDGALCPFEPPLFLRFLGFGLLFFFLLDPGILFVKIWVLPPVGGADQLPVLENVDPRNLNVLGG